MICWSCERAAGEGAQCGNCGALLPLAPAGGPDHFAVLGLPRVYAVDLKGAEETFRALSRQFHPDRFAKADPRARRASLQRSVQLNEAWRTIKDPVRRAEYLLRLEGFDVADDAAAARSGGGAAGASGRERIPVPAALLGEILELREELGEARADGDDARVQRMAGEMRARLGAALSRVAEELAAAPNSEEPQRVAAFERAARELIAVRYFRRFLDEVGAHDEDVAALSEGVARA